MTTPGGTGFPGQIQARDSVTLVPLDLYGDEATGTLKVAQYCYNPDTLAWERMRQPVVSPLVDDDDYQLYDYDGSGNLIYRGVNAIHGAATSAATWLIQKYTYGSDGITAVEKLVGAWDSRSGLSWV